MEDQIDKAIYKCKLYCFARLKVVYTLVLYHNYSFCNDDKGRIGLNLFSSYFSKRKIVKILGYKIEFSSLNQPRV